MYLRNAITFSAAAYMVVVLSGCGGSNDSKPAVTNNSQSSAAMSSSVASTASSTASVASSTPSSAASSVSSTVASSVASSAASSAPIAIIQDTTLVLPSSLEVVTNEAAK